MWKFIPITAVILTACAAPQSAPIAKTVPPAAITPALEADISPVTSVPSGQMQAVEPIQTAGLAGLELSQDQRFSAWKQDFIARAIAKGYSAALLEQTIKPASYNKKAVADNASQPEFTKPIWSYVKTAASSTRLAKGGTKLLENKALFDQIEARYGVDRNILTAIWGLESSFGAVQGSYDAINVLATFAFEGRRQEFGETQLFALLDLLKAGDIRTDQLKSSWAGAMGMTQFIPATFRDYAVDFNADGNKDLWSSNADALGSAAHYLSRFGWRKTEPAFAEVTLPANFNYALADGDKRFISVWQGLGLRPYQGGNFTADAAMLEAKLYLPAGANGPALLTFKNFDVIKRYNNSNSYAMGISTLGMNLSGKRGISAPWPEGDTQISRTQKKMLQTALTAQGFDTKGVDGAIGPNSIKAIRGWQTANNVPADGYVELELYKKIVTSAGMTP